MEAKRILYCASSRERERSFLAMLGAVPGCSRGRDTGGHLFDYDGIHLRVVTRHDPCEAVEALHHSFFNLVLLDLRNGHAPTARLKEEAEKALSLLDKMDEEPDVELRYCFDRILVLVSGADSLAVDDLIATLGARGVGRIIRDTSVCVHDPACPRLPARADFGKTVLEAIAGMTLHRERGKRALCAAGGGITGVYFEMGALKCLDDCLGPGALNAFDMYFGISAGAVVAGILANGYSIDEFMAVIADEEGGRLPPMSLSLLRVAHLNLGGLVWPVEKLLRGARETVKDVFAGRIRIALERLFLEYNDLLTAPFNAAGFEEILRRAFSRPGKTNDFRKLSRRLYIGATDQDAREHVLFGDEGHDDVPISQAIQASISINPAFCSTKIRGRYYEDGAVTRTSDFTEAIRKGSDLIFALDPFVPYVAKRPGFARERGILYNVDQDIRTVSFTRFETTRYWVLRRHPEVSLYTFLPANRLRKVMSVNPMDHRPFLKIWRGAYLSTLQRMLHLRHRMSGDLTAHGLSLDTSRAEEVGKRLEATEHPAFSDFFPDGKVDIRRPALRKKARPKAKRSVPRLRAVRSAAA